MLLMKSFSGNKEWLLKSCRRWRNLEGKGALMEKAFFVYAWDLIAEGPENALGKIQDLGANTICLASSYHAGKFTRPRAASGKIFF